MTGCHIKIVQKIHIFIANGSKFIFRTFEAKKSIKMYFTEYIPDVGIFIL